MLRRNKPLWSCIIIQNDIFCLIPLCFSVFSTLKSWGYTVSTLLWRSRRADMVSLCKRERQNETAAKWIWLIRMQHSCFNVITTDYVDSDIKYLYCSACQTVLTFLYFLWRPVYIWESSCHWIGSKSKIFLCKMYNSLQDLRHLAQVEMIDFQFFRPRSQTAPTLGDSILKEKQMLQKSTLFFRSFFSHILGLLILRFSGY